MSKFQNYLKTFDITSTLTEEDIDKTLALLQIYGPAVRRTASRIGEMEEECYEGRRQSISDFINLAIDYDRDTDRKRIADRLAEMGHSMQLLSVMEDALVLVKDTPPNGGTYFKHPPGKGTLMSTAPQMRKHISTSESPHLHTIGTSSQLSVPMRQASGVS
mgnify:CR=1 FL=1